MSKNKSARIKRLVQRNRNKRAKRERDQTQLLFETLEPRQMLANSGFAGNDCAPDLDLSSVAIPSVVAGQPLSANLFTFGATIEDRNGDGTPSGDSIRLLLDPDVGTDTPTGATLTTAGVFSWTPTTSQIGTHTITVIAVDGGSPALADAETFTVNVVPDEIGGNTNTAPNLAAIPNQNATLGQELVVDVTATDADAGQTLTFLLDTDNSPLGATITKTSDTTATIRWTPQAADLPGLVGFRVIVTDDGDLPLADSESFSATIGSSSTNQMPTIVAIPDQTASVGTQLVVNVTAADADSSDTLTFSLDTSNNATPTDAILQRVSNTTATIRWTPNVADIGAPVPFRVLVTDNGSPALTDAATFSVAVSAAVNSTLLAESGAFSKSLVQAVDLGQTEGTRTLSFSVDAAIDESDTFPAAEDLFQVYLVDSNDPSQTLLDNGKPGTALFTLQGDTSEYQPGLVRFDGSQIEVDVTSLGTMTTANLVFQLVNSDNDDGSKVAIGPIASTADPDALEAPALRLTSSPVNPAGALDLTAFTATAQVEVFVKNVRYNETTGDYTAEITTRNNGPAIGRRVAMTFPGLPVDVTFDNASGTDSSGDPYINFAAAIGSGGLAAGASSRPVTIRLSNPNGVRFSLIPTVLSGGANSVPSLGLIAPITAVPGDVIQLRLDGQDADGDTLTYSLSSPDPLPGGMLMADGRLIFKPAPGQQGSYAFTVTVSDGIASVSQSSSIVVQTDPITTTRFSGTILDTTEAPIVGIPIELRATDGSVLLNAVTNANGEFTLESTSTIAPDTLVVRGDLVPQNGPTDPVFPFIAEKLPLVLGHSVYDGAKNVMDRPIYLPALDVAGGTVVDPTQDTTVNQDIAPGQIASVFVQAGSLKMDDGSGTMVDFTGTLSITEVPASLTPAALPVNLIPDTVVTIQPGEMVFTNPAPLTLPNRGNFAPGTIMDLWSINPATGDFDQVGQGQVTTDGQFIETISGGINNSSWHIFAPQPVTPHNPETKSTTPKPQCNSCKAKGPNNSEVELHSGALSETHDLVTYSSLGETRGLQFYYESLHADAQPILRFGYDNIPAGDPRILVAELEIMRGEFMFQVPGYAGGNGLDGGEHFWTLPAAGGSIEASLQADLSGLPSGVYNYVLRTGLFNRTIDGQFSGTTTDTTGTIVITNTADSPLGAGWSLAGQQQIVENPDGSVLLLDGGGTRYQFEADTANPGQFLKPPSDFSVLEKLGDGTYRRTMTNQTVYQFNDRNQLATMTDRNGRATTWQYSAQGQLEKWIDPVGLETIFNFTGNRVTSVVDPAGRTTQLQYDSAGNLAKIVDPDNSERTFGYDNRHRMTSEINQRGNFEESFYDFAGRVVRGVMKDGSERQFMPVQTQVLLPPSDTIDPDNIPVAFPLKDAMAMFSDANGSVEEVMLDQFGQAVSRRDAEGLQTNVTRDDNNLVMGTSDSRGFTTDYVYDDFGNVLSVTDRLGSLTGGSLFVTGHDSDDHDNGEYQRAGLDFLTFGRQATTADELAERTITNVGYLGNTDGAQNGATESGYTSRTFIDLDDANWANVAFDGTFDILMIGTGGDFVGTAGSLALNSEADRFADFFNTGGGIFVNTDQADIGQSFYEFLPTFGATQAAVGGTGVYGVTAEGLAIGLTEAIVDADATHTEYQNVDTSIFRVFETHDQTGDPVAIGLFQGFIGDGTIGGVGNRFFAYDPSYSQVVSSTDELGRQTLYELDPTTGNRLSMREVVGQVDDATNGETDDVVTQFTYTSLGLIDTTTDPLGRVTDFDYDTIGRLTTVTFAVGTTDEASQLFEYDTAGNQTAVVDENGNRTQFTYDDLNRLLQITEPDPDGAGPLLPPVTLFSYDTRGNLLTTTDSLGNVTSNSYDPMDRLAATVDAVGQTTGFAYDEAGNLAGVSDPLGFTTQNVYDGRNRLVETVDPEVGITRFKYDSDDNLASLTDPVGNVTKFFYDARDRLVQEIDPLGASTNYVYDAADNLVRKTDRNARVSEFEYDELDRLMAEMWLGDDGTTAENTIDYSYNKAGNLLQVDDVFSGLGFTYDNRDRVQTVDNAGTPNTPNVVLTYAYDGVGNVLSVTDVIDGAARATTGYAYDALNRTISVQQSGPTVSGKLVDFTYNELGQFDKIARYSDLTRINLVAVSDYEYDKLNRLTDLNHTNSANEVLAFYDFEYDPSSRITKLTDINGVTDYSYDDRSQLTGADRGAGDARGDESYAYDENGNRTDSHLHGGEYETGDGNRLSSDDTYEYEYDAEGNTIMRTEIAIGNFREFEWDHRNRLVRVTDFSTGGIITQDVDFNYDSLDRRISKTVDADGAGGGGEVSTIFINDREDVLLDFVDADGSGAIFQPTIEKRYFHGPRVDQVISQEGNAGVQWLLSDHLGTVRDIVDNSAIAINHVEFDGFGILVSESNNVVSSRYAFTGREFDQEIGLYYFRARFYDPAVSLFLSEDPIGILGSGTNFYAYVGNSPNDRNDPWGLEVNIVARNLNVPIVGGAGAHTWVEVVDGKNRVTYSGIEQDGKLVPYKNYPDDKFPSTKVPETLRQTIPPPEGMTQQEWDNAVKKAGEFRLRLPPTAYDALSRRQKGLNCNDFTRGLITGAGGSIPKNFDPPGLNPGLTN